MESIKELYKIGNGPSSSHTIGPKYAAKKFAKKNPAASSFKVFLYGSLALTGKGHMTDYIIKKTLPKETEIIWKQDEYLPLHPNGMIFEAYDNKQNKIDEWEVYSIGGGALADKNTKPAKCDIYPHTNMKDIIKHLEEKGGTLWEYVYGVEDKNFQKYLKKVWETMKSAIERGLEADGTLPGILKLQRKAPSYFVKANMQNKFAEDDTYLFAYALLLLLLKKMLPQERLLPHQLAGLPVFCLLFYIFSVKNMTFQKSEL